jgi:hypothetical protein
MKFEKLKGLAANIKKVIKPNWKKVVLFIFLFLVLPQEISNDFVFFGGVYIIKSLFELYQPFLNFLITVVVLVVSYLVACIAIWIYDTKINKFIVTEGEEEVQPPEKEEQKETSEQPKEEKVSQ